MLLYAKKYAICHFCSNFAIIMLITTQAIVLHTIKYGDQKLITDLYTRRQGRLSFAVNIPKTTQGKLKKQYFQPLTMLTIEADLRQQAPLQKLRDVALLAPFSSLLTNPSKLSISIFISEFLYHALRSEQQDEPMFDYIAASLQWLDGCTTSYANFHLVFLMHLSRFLGFYPNLDQPIGEHATPLYFDLRAASFCQHPPVHRDFLPPEEAGMLRLMMRMDYPTMHLFQLNRQQRNRCIEVALQFYRLHLPDFPDLRSLDVLRELWND
jgi:DNA repair protein RecO (recombination protein O)